MFFKSLYIVLGLKWTRVQWWGRTNGVWRSSQACLLLCSYTHLAAPAGGWLLEQHIRWLLDV
jgi:hypothetical protein